MTFKYQLRTTGAPLPKQIEGKNCTIGKFKADSHEIVEVLPKEWFQLKVFSRFCEFISSSRGKRLVKLLAKVTEISSQTARKDPELAVTLSNFEKDVCGICNYYQRIIASTKSLVNYCSNQTVIPSIIQLIKDKCYLEANNELKGFMKSLKRLIKRINADIEMALNNLAGSKVIQSSSTSSILRGIKSSMGTVDVAGYTSGELWQNAESSIIEICGCVSGFTEELSRFQSDIVIIEEMVDKLKLDKADVYELDGTYINGWTYKQNILQAIFENFYNLCTHIAN